MKFSYFVLFLLLLFPGFAFAQEKSSPQLLVDEWATQEQLEHAAVGIYLFNASTGEVLASTEPQLSMVPASTLKLLTTGAALEILGPDYHFKTSLAYSGEVINDTLVGDLIIKGGGDPALGSKYFKEHYLENNFLDAWVDSLKSHGISHITGNIIADASIYEDQLVPSTWIWEDMGNYFGAGACGISVYDNTYEIHLSSPKRVGEQTNILFTKPLIPGLEINNLVLSSEIQSDRAYVFGSPLDNDRTIRGTIPAGRSDFVIKASVPNPPFLLGWDLRLKLNYEDILVDGDIDVRFQHITDEQKTTLAETFSPPLIDIIEVTNHESVNLFAEHILKQLAYVETGVGSTENGIEVVTDFWKEKGIGESGFFMADGSGLSRFNAITAKQMVAVLAYLKSQTTFGEIFINSLPTVPNGTLYYFHAENFPNNSLRAKSGSMTRVRCFAGQLTTDSGQEILFAVFLNNFSCTQSRAISAIEDLLSEVRTY